MKFFGFRIISEGEYQELHRGWITHMHVRQCCRWFSGWKDLDVIWNFVLGADTYGGVERARKEYAKLRGTDEYGNKVD